MATTATKTRVRSPRRPNPAERAAEPAMESKPRRPTEEQIRERAYQLYVQRGCIPGNPIVDWLDAEHQLLLEMAQADS